MATSFLFNRVNISGIPCIESQSVSASTTAVTYTFNPQVLASPRFSGLIAVKITQAVPEAGATLPIQFSMGGQIISLTKAGGEAVIGSDLVTGIYMVFYDRISNILQTV